MTGASGIGQVEALLRARRVDEAARLLIELAARGDAAAISELASWRIAGDVVRRDLAEARALLGKAAAGGDREAALLHASFLASGVGGEPQWRAAFEEIARLAPGEPRARAQLDLLREMDLDDEGFPARPAQARPLSASPWAVASDAFLSAAECAYLKAALEPDLQPSVVVDPASGRMVPHPVRTSDGAVYGVFAEDLVVSAINRRIAAFSGTGLAQGEPLQLLRYRPGAEYRAHMDALPAEPNQRVMTALVYLSDDYEGGETRFLRTGLDFRGRIGNVLLFRNAREDGTPDPMSLHAGLPVTRGVKYIASRWIRARAFAFPPPRPLLDL
jgi:prolyl 4-hydroxylase